MKIVYMGTPDFAVAPLEALLAAGHTVTAVVTQPDKPKGRSGKLQMSPVKECALQHDIPVLQPVKIKQAEEIERLKQYEADVYVVAAFGQILSQEILDLPRYGSLCVHASLLPAYRGASPINRAILDGQEKSGVTIMQMDAGIDTGDILTQAEVVIEDTDTDLSLEEKLSKAGAALIVETLQKLEAGTLTATKQDDSKSCYAKLLTKAMGQIDWSKSALSIDRQVRGLYSWPGAYTSCKGKMLKIWQAKPVAADAANSEAAAKNAACAAAESQNGNTTAAQSVPGSIAKVTKNEIFVNTGDGLLCLQEVQLEGKKRMKVHDFLLGCKVEEGEVLG